MKKEIEICPVCEEPFVDEYKKFECIKCNKIIYEMCILEHLHDEKMIEIIESDEIIVSINDKKKKIILICDYCEGEIEINDIGYKCPKCGIVVCDFCADESFIEHIYSEHKT